MRSLPWPVGHGPRASIASLLALLRGSRVSPLGIGTRAALLSIVNISQSDGASRTDSELLTRIRFFPPDGPGSALGTSTPPAPIPQHCFGTAGGSWSQPARLFDGDGTTRSRANGGTGARTGRARRKNSHPHTR